MYASQLYEKTSGMILQLNNNFLFMSQKQTISYAVLLISQFHV